MVVPFFRGIAQGWVEYYNKAKTSGPKFTEEQIRQADHVAEILNGCHPITDVIDSETHLGVCQSLNKGKFLEASIHLENELPSLTNRGWCQEALKIGVWLLGTCSPTSIRDATFNLLGCNYYFKTV